ncbi:IucA/IucC family protein [Guptibacillus hwajinpoensis]|uniref:IucA/IucC family protein n=1 Tax=Guptibacillus hwajinpoensis TaxID=208199 RepID=UPI003734E519
MVIQFRKSQLNNRSDNDVMLEEEGICMRFLMKQQPSEVNRYMANLDKGRKGILHKLASSILRENINNFYANAFTLKKMGSVYIVNQEKDTKKWKAFFKHIQEYPIREDLTYKVVELSETFIVFPIQHEFAFQRIETTDDILSINSSGITCIKLASELCELLFGKTQVNLDHFMDELNNGTANLALAYMYEELWKKEIQKEANHLGADSTGDYLLKKKKADPGFSQSLFLEQLVLDGHHLHPGAKTKMGLNPEDVFRYSPEFHQPFSVRFVAVNRKYVLTTSIETQHFLEPYFPDQLEECIMALRNIGLTPDAYEIIPVHEWQYVHAIPSVYEKELDEGTIIMIEGVKLEAEATSSFRTVHPKNSSSPSLKLAVNSQMTSTIRSISTQTAMNSTLFTSMIKTIMDREPLLKNFIPLNEIAGAAFNSNETLKSRNLTMLLRENIEQELKEDELAVAGPALYAQSPLSEQTILAELVTTYAKANNLAKNSAVFPFFEDYITTVIPGYLTLMVKYGVALEGHLQNSIPVFKEGRLSRFFFRDWGGARIYQERLDQQGIEVTFTDGSVSVTDQQADMHNKLYYTVFQNHLGEIVRQLVQYSGVEEDALWKRVKHVCNDTLHSLANQGIEENIASDREFLFQPKVMHKSLTKMRLTDAKDYCYTEVANPLHHMDKECE